MRLSHCESHCAGPFRFIPCLLPSKDASRDAASAPAPRPAAVAEEEPPPVQKIEVPEAGKAILRTHDVKMRIFDDLAEAERWLQAN